MLSDLLQELLTEDLKTWETDQYVITELLHPSDLMYYSRKTGWCVRHVFSAVSYALQGPTWGIRKKGKHRPSYMLWKNTQKHLSYTYDFRHTTSSTPDLASFVFDNPELAEWFAYVAQYEFSVVFNPRDYRDIMLDTSEEEADDPERLQCVVSGLCAGNPYPERNQIAHQTNELVTRRRMAATRGLDERIATPFDLMPLNIPGGLGRVDGLTAEGHILELRTGRYPSPRQQARDRTHPARPGRFMALQSNDLFERMREEMALSVTTSASYDAELDLARLDALMRAQQERVMVRRPVEMRTGRSDAADAFHYMFGLDWGAQFNRPEEFGTVEELDFMEEIPVHPSYPACSLWDRQRTIRAFEEAYMMRDDEQLSAENMRQLSRAVNRPAASTAFSEPIGQWVDPIAQGRVLMSDNRPRDSPKPPDYPSIKMDWRTILFINVALAVLAFIGIKLVVF